MRDEFDPIHKNNRAGWYQRELRPSRAKVLERFQDLNEEDLREIVLEIITKAFIKTKNHKTIINNISDEDNDNNIYVPRSVTGTKAEEIFIEYHKKNQKPVSGKLIDTRDRGCGYDFEVKNTEGNFYYVEVKGLAKELGGVQFTNKEWQIAKKEGDKYYLVVISNISKKYNLTVICNPVSKLNPNKNIYEIIQVNWNVSPKDLSSFIK